MNEKRWSGGIALALLFALASTACNKDGKSRDLPDTSATDSRDTNDTGSDTDIDTEIWTTGLAVGDAAVRACDVLLEDGETKIVGVEFAEGVRGESGRMMPRFAFAFSSTQDSAFEGAVAILKLRGEDLDEIGVLEVSCFDRTGTKVEEPGVRLDGRPLGARR